jgi:hypothetical protein
VKPENNSLLHRRKTTKFEKSYSAIRTILAASVMVFCLANAMSRVRMLDQEACDHTFVPFLNSGTNRFYSLIYDRILELPDFRVDGFNPLPVSSFQITHVLFPSDNSVPDLIFPPKSRKLLHDCINKSQKI